MIECVLFRHEHGRTEALTAWNNGDLVDGHVAVVEDAFNQCVAGFVEGDDLAVFIVHQLATFATKGDLVPGFVDIVHLNGLLIITSCDERTFVQEVGEVGTRKTRCVASDVLEVYLFGKGDLFSVDE